MRIAPVALFVLLTGCAVNGFEKYYNPSPIAETIASNPWMVDKPPAVPKVYTYSDDPKADMKRLAEDGYLAIGSSSFYGPPKMGTKAQLIEQGKKVGAAVILVHSKYHDTVTGTVPYTVANPPQVATVNTSGTVNTFSGGGANSTSTVTMPGGPTTYNIPYSVTRNDYVASYWVARDPHKMRLGTNTVPLPDDVRTRLQRNTGVYVPIVVRGTPAFNSNVLEGDVIVGINGADVSDPKGFTDQLTQYAGQTVKLSIIRGSEPVSISVKLNQNPPGVH